MIEKMLRSLGIKKSLFILLFLLSFSVLKAQKTYSKIYYSNGQLKEEGWLTNKTKTDYWKFYYPNGNLKKEGHYQNGLSNKYWIFYTENNTKMEEGHFENGKMVGWWISYENDLFNKCQIVNNEKNGYCLVYQKEKLIKAEQYFEGEKINEWTSIFSFKKDNAHLKF